MTGYTFHVLEDFARGEDTVQAELPDGRTVPVAIIRWPQDVEPPPEGFLFVDQGQDEAVYVLQGAPGELVTAFLAWWRVKREPGRPRGSRSAPLVTPEEVAAARLRLQRGSVDRITWPDVAEELGVSESTAKRAAKRDRPIL